MLDGMLERAACGVSMSASGGPWRLLFSRQPGRAALCSLLLRCSADAHGVVRRRPGASGCGMVPDQKSATPIPTDDRSRAPGRRMNIFCTGVYLCRPADLLARHRSPCPNPAILESIPGQPVDSLPHGPGPCEHSHAGGKARPDDDSIQSCPRTFAYSPAALVALPGLEEVAGQIAPLIAVLRAEQARRRAGIEIRCPVSMAKLRSPLVARKKSPPLGLIRSWPGWFLLWLWLGAYGRNRRR
jgi:hypothetical protein